MTAIRPIKSTWLALGLPLFVFLLACGDDSTGDNPLGATLTPPVELQVTLDDTTGTAILTWTPYEGDAFAAYWVLRALQASDRVDTLAIITDLTRTSFVDSTSLTGLFYSYRISAINSGGLEVPSTAQSGSLNHPQVEILSLSFESRTASASLSWSPYNGARFKAYRLFRRAGQSLPEMVAEIPDIATTSAVDDGLKGNTEYRYRVVVLTDLDEEITSEENAGLFHPLVDTWPLDMEEGEHVRLYKEGDSIAALISGPRRVRLLSFASDGQLAGERLLLEHPWLDIQPHTAAMTFLPDGARLLGVATNAAPPVDSKILQLLPYDADGSPLPTEYEVDHDIEPFGPSPAEVEGQIFLASLDEKARIDNVRLTSDDRRLVFDEFETADLGEWELLQGQARVDDGSLLVSDGALLRRKITASWHDVRMEADVTGIAAIAVKADTLPLGAGPFVPQYQEHTSLMVSLTYGYVAQHTKLLILPPLDSGLQPGSFASYLAHGSGLTYRPRIEIDAGLVKTAVVSPSSWPSEHKQQMRGVLEPVSLISVGESMAFAVGDSLIRVASGRGDHTLALSHPVSEMRLWDAASESRLSICVPDQHEILIAPTQVARTGYIDWPFGSEETLTIIGSEAGKEPGDFFYPLSFDVGSDDRIFVLDAGNRTHSGIRLPGGIHHWMG